MQFLLTPHSSKKEDFAFWKNAFNTQEIDLLQNLAKNSNVRALVGGGGASGLDNPYVRRSNINWLECNTETKWIYERLSNVVSSLNAQFFNFDLTGFGEHIQLTNYNSSEKGMYDWHVDGGSNPSTPCRKLSLVMQLSDPVEYEGGILELKTSNNEPIKLSKERGLITCFASFTLHRVTEVLQGSRQSLVAWISGPPFK